MISFKLFLAIGFKLSVDLSPETSVTTLVIYPGQNVYL